MKKKKKDKVEWMFTKNKCNLVSLKKKKKKRGSCMKCLETRVKSGAAADRCGGVFRGEKRLWADMLVI